MSNGNVEDQVRRRLQERLVAAGVGRSEVALEVLYWLPREFLEDYRALFMKALELGDGAKSGRGNGTEVAKIPSRLRGKVPNAGGTGSGSGSGRFYRGEWIVADETALELKNRVDRQLKGLVRKMAALMAGGFVGGSQGDGSERESRGSRGGDAGGDRRHGSRGGESHGSTPGVGVSASAGVGAGGEGRLVEMRGGNGKKVCKMCGRIAGRDWVRCPYPHLLD